MHEPRAANPTRTRAAVPGSGIPAGGGVTSATTAGGGVHRHPGGGVPPPPPGGGVLPPPPGGGANSCRHRRHPGAGKTELPERKVNRECRQTVRDEPEGNPAGGTERCRQDKAWRWKAGKFGVSNTLGAGSTRALGRTGRAETRLPQRVLAMERPSVNNVSPFASANFCLVQIDIVADAIGNVEQLRLAKSDAANICECQNRNSVEQQPDPSSTACLNSSADCAPPGITE